MAVSLPLQKLFEQLRKAGLPLGVDQYALAVEALVQLIEDGFDPTDIEAVKRFCQTVWVKSPAEQRLFEKSWGEVLFILASSQSPSKFSLFEEDEGERQHREEEDRPPENIDKNQENDSEIPAEFVTLEATEIQVGRAVSVFWKEAYYFPVSCQQLKDGWQKFQPQTLPSRRAEIDILATVEQVAKAGFFTKPEFTQPATIAKPPQVLLLIDQQGSMTPFHPFCRHLVKIWNKAKVYYFQNCPTDGLYSDPQLRQIPEDLETVLENLPTKNTVAMIISDAGAAKQRSIPSRWEETVDFFNILTAEVQRVAWLNPLPRGRWLESTAEDIAQIYPEQVPMFALASLEWKHMIQWLRWGEKSALQLIQQQEAGKPEALEENWNWEFDAVSRVNAFEAQYGKGHLDLACHAAFPLTLTPDLLYRLWQKFLGSNPSEENVPWYAVADFLLSDLCHPIDTELTELYEIEREIRNELLQQCQHKFGEKRLEELSEFLIDYLDQQIQKQLLPTWLESFYEMQHWAALAYTNPDKAAQKIAAALKQAYLHHHKSELVQWSELAATLTPVLPEEKYRPLLVAAKGYGAEARGIAKGTQAARQEWEASFGQEEMVSLGGVELAKPGSVIGRIPLKTFTFTTITLNRKGETTRRETKQAQFLTEDLGNGVTLEMVYIPGGTFTMGSPKGEGHDDEKPQHPVTLKPFLMGKYPVTQAQWQAVANLPKIHYDLDPDPSGFKHENRPVEQVSWYDTLEFCARLSQKTGRSYRLPSEAEWEYACRAGTTTPFHFGETITSDVANYRGNQTYAEEPKGQDRGETTPVGSFQVANAFGLYDLHGNVWEWCADPWHGNYEGAPTDGSVWDENYNDNHYQIAIDFLVNIKNDERRRLLRGGSWDFNPAVCRSAIRNDYVAPDVRSYVLGFRLVCAVAWTP